ncbi:EF-hand domain-containing protein [Arenimonas oryziterrae]|uniref:EF-hand domain-containing protein n=1 Tax=Arenimonas oryziterrae DSM 21050 = YC6267 TaxID=1121015 RepID=A0A091APM4_9GAMM|nr:EF-hand domain-containing protein [Arenimonas oryziterrae]KFN41331.1 hypothetical protein N789_05500 [Arenimonas oryziterrae DSM 21050 = YC6267]
MSNKTFTPARLAGAVVLGGLAFAQASFAFTPLSQGYASATATAAKPAEGKCGEGKCGMAMTDTNKDGRISAAEHAARAKTMFAAMDKNHDGMVSADEMKAAHEGKCGEGKCGAGKTAAAEGSCGADKGKTEGSCSGKH